MEKSTKLSYKPNNFSASHSLEYVHCDLWGPSIPPIIGGARYYISIMDDCTKQLRLNTLKNKTDVFQKFKLWTEDVENEKTLRIKYLRTGNGLKFLSREFSNI